MAHRTTWGSLGAWFSIADSGEELCGIGRVGKCSTHEAGPQRHRVN